MFAVIFEVQPHPEAWDDYLGHAATLRPELLRIDGFLDNERFASRSRPGWLVSLSLWRNEKALIRWRTHAGHHLVQGEGRSAVFADYRLRVGEVAAETSAEGPLPQQRLDETEVSAAHAISLTEPPAAPPTSDPRQSKRTRSKASPVPALFCCCRRGRIQRSPAPERPR